jgi:hypothetical protein
LPLANLVILHIIFSSKMVLQWPSNSRVISAKR